MQEQFRREVMLIGEQGLRRLQQASVILFGVGGVGSAVAEALARAGVGSLCLVDPDVVEETNLNRQLIALHSNIGVPKVEAAARRVLDINPDCSVTARVEAYGTETAANFSLGEYTYVADAVDNMTAKILLAETCLGLGVPLISCMGTANKADPTQLRVSDISKTMQDPLARIMRKELRYRGIKHLNVVWSPEEPYAPVQGRLQGTFSFVPPAAGMIMAGRIIMDIVGGANE